MTWQKIKLGIVFLACFVILSAASDPNDMETVFKTHEVVPDVIETAPSQFLKISYKNGLDADKGVELTPTQVKEQPTVEWDADPNSFYTLIMTDPDAPSRQNPRFREFNHWLVGNIPGNAIEKGDVLTAYVGSGPPKDTGLHRYVFLLYKQPDKLHFDEELVGNNSRKNRPKFSASNFAKKYNLGQAIAGNFYQAQYDDYVPTVHKQLSEN